ncbi:GIY-YIG nuclease family protein [Prevotella cerevisiae]|jgi:hypothetical protein|uniref:GIY-YIG nuclease family protein n=1 Tax=Segatella cerevisiae TaxID=2053716 RepID=A0ABT1BZ06_9BACT|nr:GIY-YIG nuclease family protein [Segatella cerevisiae]MCO6026325.1 GIY-YIG nuclease family protein [Segatella cerevisiae]
MNIKKELDDILNDPLLNISDREKSLFEIPSDMKKVQGERNQPDHYAQRKVCEDFALYKSGFEQIHQDLRCGRRSLVKTSKTDSMVVGRYYVVEGQLLLLQRVENYIQAANGLKDGRTRCIIENGTETDILLQTLRKNVMANGYAVSDTEEETGKLLMNADFVSGKDQETGYIYVLSSLSQRPEIAGKKDLYKIGFTTRSVEERIAGAADDPTYLMSPVKIVATYKIVNMNSHVLETLLHHVLDAVQMQFSITDQSGKLYHPQEWYVVPLEVINTIIGKINDGSITNYTYNVQQQCLEQIVVKNRSTFNTKGMKILKLSIKKIYFDQIMRGEKAIEYRELKQTTLNKYTYIDEDDGKRYLRRYDALRLCVGYHKNCESAIVEIKDIIYKEGMVEYHLGHIFEHLGSGK